MQLSDIRTRVRYHLREANASIWADAEIDSHINLAQKWLALRLDQRYLPQLIQVQTYTYDLGTPDKNDLPSTFVKPAGDPYAADGDVYPLIPMDEAVKYISHTYDSYSILSDKRISWIQNDDLYIRPEATSSITVFMPYIDEPTDLSNDVDVSEINDGIIDLVIMKAASDSLLKTQEFDSMRALMSDLEKRIEILNQRV